MSDQSNFGPASSSTPTARPRGWPRLVAPFRQADCRKSLGQLLVTWTALIALWGVAYAALSVSLALTLLVDVLIAGIAVRLFIIQHDCGHESFFASKRANRLAGLATSVLTFTPFGPWRTAHAIHHATTGDLGRRGTGDVTTWTVAEYLSASPMERLTYRFIRHPLVILLFGPAAVFAVSHRLPSNFPDGDSREVKRSVHITTVGNLAVLAGLYAAFGWQGLVFVHVPAFYLAGSVGIFLFFVQHQFADAYWRRGEDWSFVDACFAGCSHLRLHPVLAWFTGDIGVHHLHHLAPRIPNYALRACLRSSPGLEAETTLTLREALGAFQYKLYDAERGRMVRFDEMEARSGATSSLSPA